MQSVDKLILYIALLSALLIGVVYYLGVQTDAATFGSVFNTLLLTATGRNAQGQFANYPTTQKAA